MYSCYFKTVTKLPFLKILMPSTTKKIVLQSAPTRGHETRHNDVTLSTLIMYPWNHCDSIMYTVSPMACICGTGGWGGVFLGLKLGQDINFFSASHLLSFIIPLLPTEKKPT